MCSWEQYYYVFINPKFIICSKLIKYCCLFFLMIYVLVTLVFRESLVKKLNSEKVCILANSSQAYFKLEGSFSSELIHFTMFAAKDQKGFQLDFPNVKEAPVNLGECVFGTCYKHTKLPKSLLQLCSLKGKKQIKEKIGAHVGVCGG